MGEENKEIKEKEESTEEKKEEEEERKEEKKEEEVPPEIILKVDMHCEACARKVARSLKGFEGVEEVSTDSKTSKVAVKGKKADAMKVCERLQKKSGRKVELISPLPKPPPENIQENKDDEPKEEKKDEPPGIITVVLKVQMHCEACAQVLRRRIRKIRGVESVETDLGNNQVVVKGVIDPTTLVDNVYKRTRKQASIVRDEEKKKDEDRKEKEGDQKKDGEENKEEDDKSKIDIKKIELWPSRYYLENSYPPADQIFSDENPNACSLM